MPGAYVSVRGAAFIGIGSMVGAGIFALLGQAAVIAGSAVWLSFLLAGLVTALLAYNVVKLGIRYPSEGGLIEYLRQGFGNGRLLGIASWLGYAAAFVVVAAMLAVSFGSYATTLFVGDDAWSGWDNVFASLLIVVMTLVNMVGATFVSRVASVMVVVLLVRVRRLHRRDDLGRQLRPPRLQRLPVVLEDHLQHRADVLRVPRLRRDDVHGRQPPRSRARAAESGGARAGADDGHLRADLDRRLRDAHRDRGDRLRRDGDRRGRAADARRRRLHADGGRRAHRDGRRDERDALRRGGPHGLAGGDRAVSSSARPRSRLGKHGGLLVTGVLALVLANFVDLSAIASVGSACSLVVFLLVGLAGYRLRSETGASAAIVLVGMAATAIVLGFFAVDTLRNAPETFVAIVAMTLLAVGLDLVWKRVRGTPADTASAGAQGGAPGSPAPGLDSE